MRIFKVTVPMVLLAGVANWIWAEACGELSEWSISQPTKNETISTGTESIGAAGKGHEATDLVVKAINDEGQITMSSAFDNIPQGGDSWGVNLLGSDWIAGTATVKVYCTTQDPDRLMATQPVNFVDPP